MRRKEVTRSASICPCVYVGRGVLFAQNLVLSVSVLPHLRRYRRQEGGFKPRRKQSWEGKMMF